MDKVWSLTTLLLSLLLASLCEGVELDLDLDPPTQPGSRAACAVLRCVERSPDATTGSPAQNLGRNISRLTIFKTIGKDGDGSEVEVASLTPNQPRVTRVSEGIKVNGILQDGSASITLELFKTSDCCAGFVCQLRSLDAKRKESVSTLRVNQREKKLHSDHQSLTPSVALQILELVHQMDTKLTISSKSTEKLEKKMEHFEREILKLEEKLVSKLAILSKTTEQMKFKVHTLENRLEDKIASAQRDLHQDLGLLQDHLEDKMEDGLEKKLSDVHLKITAFTTKAESYSDNLRISLNESVTKLGHYLKQDQKEALTNLTSAAQYLLDNQSKATGALITATRNLTITQKDLLNEMQTNLAMAASEITESSDTISTILSNEFASLEQDFQDSFQRLASDVNQSAIETLSSANNLFLQTNSTISEVMRHVLSPTRCSRGVVAALSQASYPYPLIQPNSASIVDVPYLCDTVTDGGGWIVIQRRSKGDVDFYRGWEEYKNGFGDLRGDFWLGNRHIHRITSSGSYELRVELVYQKKSYYARYGLFLIADEENGYRLNVGDYSGTAGDDLAYSNGRKFTTLDRDNDSFHVNCANHHSGAWWYGVCAHSNLNGRWKKTGYDGPWWIKLSKGNPVSYTEMKVRLVSIS
ncbi:hypothetical protein RRG08_050751 [Elysia crispata]|uniref:Fibrinogen C-terminal domain-containing protein n=1 Tax=Elysia crispata TaxID=231223 RepID=A0AAE0ZSJ3_9GAST|nr:hypothetical protein RRG08_050751 [Elysia crispata]